MPDEYCNTGTCIIQNGQIACKCPPTYMGATCDTPIGGTRMFFFILVFFF